MKATIKESAIKESAVRRLAAALVVLLLTAIFVGLGLWQLDRADEMRNPPVIPIDRTIYPLLELAAPTGTIPAPSVGKKVRTSGYYIANYKAPNQIDGNGAVADWEVALLQNETDTAILVVRGLWKDRLQFPQVAMSTKVEITGTLMPRQFDDRAANTSSQLSRLDSSILVSATDYQLYDGFIIEKSEQVRGGEISRARVLEPKLSSGVPGYYWQHISYVVVWWVLAILVLWAPFYGRRKEKL
jgi:cytochrome oxidase assembly protein ShyY1